MTEPVTADQQADSPADEAPDLRTTAGRLADYRARVDEAVLGEVDGPMDNPIDGLLATDRKAPTDGRPAKPVKPTTQHISSGTQPDEWGR